MKRRLFNLAAAVSLTLYLFFLVMWIGGYFRWGLSIAAAPRYPASAIRWNTAATICRSGARLKIYHTQRMDPAYAAFTGVSCYPWMMPDPSIDRYQGDRIYSHAYLLGLFWYGEDDGVNYVSNRLAERGHIYTLITPTGTLVALTAILPAVWLKRTLRRRREIAKGHCLVCGYDLRAHNAGDRCPECGTVLSPAR